MTNARSIHLIPDKLDYKSSAAWILIGLCVVLLSGWLPLIPNYATYIHMWRVELAASIFIVAVVAFPILKHRTSGISLSLSSLEIKFIVLPIAVFILWSGLSMLWATSWKSGLHHTTVWAVYLCFFLIIRQVIETTNGYDNLIRLLGITFLIVMFPAIVEYFSFIVTGGGTTLGMRYAKYGEQINALSPLITVGVLRLNGRRFVVGLLFVVTMWLFIIATLGRINLLLFVASQAIGLFLVFAIKRFRKYGKKMAFVTIALLATSGFLHVFTSLVAPANENIVSRFVSDERITDSNNFRRLMTTLSLDMFKVNPFAGIGADNFGIEVNRYRAVYGASNPQDINLTAAENDLPERVHNEFLQILAELGIVGLLLFFLSFLVGMGLMLINAFRRGSSLITFAALSGAFIFLASSLVSSYSFRFVQNGLVFFVVLAVASKHLLKQKRDKPIILSGLRLKTAGAFSVILCLALAGYSMIRVASAYYAGNANYIKSTDDTLPLYEFAFWLDNENAYARYDLASRLLDDGRYAEALPHYEHAIKLGLATSPNLSYFSTAQLLAGDTDGAEATFAYAARLYPQSTFVITRYAFLQKQNGKSDEAAVNLERARKINAPASATWWTMMNDGAEQATDNVEQNATLTPIMDLQPQRSIYAVHKERLARFPQEKSDLLK